jgi:hypothetical protein
MVCSQLQLAPKKTTGLMHTTEQLLRPTTEQLKYVSGSAATSSWSVYVARNLADQSNTETFLKGVLGEDMAKSLAPSAFRALKSSGTLYGTVAVGVVAGALYLYEQLPGSDGSADQTTFKLRAVVSPEGTTSSQVKQ